jgi:hypothetical protein
MYNPLLIILVTSVFSVSDKLFLFGMFGYILQRKLCATIALTKGEGKNVSYA